MLQDTNETNALVTSAAAHAAAGPKMKGLHATVASFRTLDPNAEDTAEIVMVPVASLEIDTSYQFDVNTEPGRLPTLKRWYKEHGGFVASQAAAIHVSLRASGRMMVIDGWGRTNMAMWDGVLYIAAVIHRGLTVQQEGELFRILNNNKRTIRSPHLFVAAANSGSEPEASILKIVKPTGYKIEKLKGEKGTVISTNALVFGYALGPIVLERALFDLRHSWGDSADARALAALCPLIATNQNVYDCARMREVLSDPTFTCEVVMAEARAKAAASVLKRRNPQPRDTNPYATLILGARYNYRLPTKEGKRLDLDHIDTLKSRFEGHNEFYKEVYRWNGEK